ncbi:hypothetical protein AA0Z99_13035 [Agrococcus sp. 1P02AA]
MARTPLAVDEPAAQLVYVGGAVHADNAADRIEREAEAELNAGGLELGAQECEHAE